MKKIIAVILTFVMLSGLAVATTIDRGTVNLNLSPSDLDCNTYASSDGITYSSTVTYTGSDYQTKAFDIKADLDLTAINTKLETLAEENISQALHADITGTFTFTITIPQGLTLSDDFYNTTSFQLADAAAGKAFEDFYVKPLEENVSVATVGTNTEISFTINVKSGIKGSDVFNNAGGEATSKLGSLITVTCQDAVVPTAEGTYNVGLVVSGWTEIAKEDDSVIYKVNYDFGTIPNATIVIDVYSGGGSGGGGGSRPTPPVVNPEDKPDTPAAPEKTVDVILGTGAEADIKDTKVSAGEKITLPETATREGFVFNGWLVNGKATKGEITINEDTVIRATWINTTPAKGLTDAHIVYINGYPDETVRPDATITRDEVVAIFYRLLTPERRAEIETDVHTFTDVEEGHWATKEIATMKNGGYIGGYPDGTFRPTNPITRGELVTIVAKFIDDTTAVDSGYTDINGHWAEEHINLVSDNAWINGYEDGTFKADEYITRAETIKIVNRMTVRHTDAESGIETATIFPDNEESAWYYYDVIEATNDHGHNRRENGYSEDWITEDAVEETTEEITEETTEEITEETTEETTEEITE